MRTLLKHSSGATRVAHSRVVFITRTTGYKRAVAAVCYQTTMVHTRSQAKATQSTNSEKEERRVTLPRKTKKHDKEKSKTRRTGNIGHGATPMQAVLALNKKMARRWIPGDIQRKLEELAAPDPWDEGIVLGFLHSAVPTHTAEKKDGSGYIAVVYDDEVAEAFHNSRKAALLLRYIENK